MKHFALKLLAASTFALPALAAQAGSGNQGFIDLSSGTAYFGNTSSHVTGSIFDTFTFSVLEPFQRVVSTVTTPQNGSHALSFSSVEIYGLDANMNLVRYSFARVASDPFETWGIDAILATPGTYSLQLYGNFNTAVPVSYSGVISLTSAIPEPSSLALMLAGIGVVGTLVSKRKVADRDLSPTT